MKGVQPHIPFLQAMAKMPLYAKFLKELISNKKTLEEVPQNDLIANIITIIQHNPPRKLNDPGSFIMASKIDYLEPKVALADLGVSVSLILLSIAK